MNERHSESDAATGRGGLRFASSIIISLAILAAVTGMGIVAGRDFVLLGDEAALDPAAHRVLKVVVSPTEVDFGVVKRSSVNETTVTVRNDGRRPVRIAEVVTTCGCTVAETPKDEILPGEAVEVRVRMRAHRKADREVTKMLTLILEPRGVEPVKLRVTSRTAVDDTRSTATSPLTATAPPPG